MAQETVKFDYNGHAVEFENRNNQVMVNATEMAKIFEKDVPDFLMLKQTKEFISECLKNQNSGFLNIETETDLYTSKQKSGTWMHRVLALKFAAWLNPAFELWVYATIDKLLFGNYRQVIDGIKKQATIKREIKKVTADLRKNETFQRLQELKEHQKQLQRAIKQYNDIPDVFDTNK